MLSKNESMAYRKELLWWRNVIEIGDSMEEEGFVSQITCKLGDDSLVSFWNTRWLGSSLLRRLFPDLFEASKKKYGVVMDMGGWVDDVWQ
ncbi:unnamed protein product [Lathyrus sativus]|nr:unnamed protein product [Lathyrus sativus]